MVVRLSCVHLYLQVSLEALWQLHTKPKINDLTFVHPQPVKLLIQEAAKSCHKNVSEFLLDALSDNCLYHE